MSTSKHTLRGLVAAIAIALSGSAFAGPYILAGTDADDHGSANGGTNQQGWRFMQRALENIAPGVTNGNKIVYSVGSDINSQAGNAALSAFNLSNLNGLGGWAFQSVNGAANISAFFGIGGASANAGIIMFDSSIVNVSGGLDSSEEAALEANSSNIDAYLGNGGGLFSQANNYKWLSAILPGVTAGGNGNSGIALTAAGTAAFPSLSSADLSSGPYHKTFTGFGAIPVLGVGTADDDGLAIGANGGTITHPNPVPEPGSLALLTLGVAGLAAARRKKYAK